MSLFGGRLAFGNVGLLLVSLGDRCIQLLLCCVETVPALLLGMPALAARRTDGDGLLVDWIPASIALRSRLIS